MWVILSATGCVAGSQNCFLGFCFGVFVLSPFYSLFSLHTWGKYVRLMLPGHSECKEG